MQADFAAAVLEGCRARGIHTAIETCGACEWGVLERLANLCDLVLFDLKLFDDQLHRQWIGASNQRIIDNARHLTGRNVVIRVPLIPGITDTEKNIASIAGFMRGARLPYLVLLPYNASAAAKYEWLGRRYAISGAAASAEQMDLLLATARAKGVRAERG